ncbi:MAG: GNAT family N-acetyltransferase [Lentisphaeria bacterium]|nr:GNAT family N-acetyltransferase [Lentisphaeria bacterium]MBO5958611.1 GNAT family N-acetyltransferase [Lentisphaeria bacterium]
MRLRAALLADAEAIAALWRASIRITCAPAYGFDETVIGPWADGKTAQTVAELIACEEFFLVADDNGTITGFLCGSFALNTFALFVDPAHLQRGIGSRLFRCYENLARISGRQELLFHSSLNAVPFYQKQGAVIAGDPVSAPRPCVPMRKVISPL